MIERQNEKCKGCRYDRTDEGAYFCLCCTLIGEYTPHIRKEDNNETATSKGNKGG